MERGRERERERGRVCKDFIVNQYYTHGISTLSMKLEMKLSNHETSNLRVKAMCTGVRVVLCTLSVAQAV